MTGLHAVHVLVGMGLMIFALVRSSRVQFSCSYFTPIEMVAIYWALVDLVFGSSCFPPWSHQVSQMVHDTSVPGHEFPKGAVIGSYFALLILAAVMIGLSQIDVDKLGIDWLNLHVIRTTLIMGTALIMGIIVSMFLMACAAKASS